MAHHSTTPVTRRGLLRTGALVVGGIGAGGVLSGCGAVEMVSGTTGTVPPRDPADRTLRIIVTESEPYQEPTKIAQKLLAAQGWELKPTYVTDIIQPNQAVDEGAFDVNFFQHVAYLKQFNKDYDTSVVPLFYVYALPGRLYSDRHASIEDIPEGATVALPVDPSNNGRAILLLREAGLITLRREPESVIEVSQSLIAQNPRNLRLVELDQQALLNTRQDVDLGFLSLRNAAVLGLTREDALVFEDGESERPFRILVGARPEFAGTEAARMLREAYQSAEVRQWFAGYQGGTLPLPWDADAEKDYAQV